MLIPLLKKVSFIWEIVDLGKPNSEQLSPVYRIWFVRMAYRNSGLWARYLQISERTLQFYWGGTWYWFQPVMVDLALFAPRKYQSIRLFKIITVFFHHISFANKNIYSDAFITWKMQCSEFTSVHISSHHIYTFTPVTKFHKSHCHRRFFFLYFLLETRYILRFTHCFHLLIKKKERLLLWYPLHEAGHFHYCWRSTRYAALPKTDELQAVK
jgi:hypothetical protein